MVENIKRYHARMEIRQTHYLLARVFNCIHILVKDETLSR